MPKNLSDAEIARMTAVVASDPDILAAHRHICATLDAAGIPDPLRERIVYQTGQLAGHAFQAGRRDAIEGVDVKVGKALP